MYGSRKPLNLGVNANVGVEPQASAAATVNNTIVVNPAGTEAEPIPRAAEVPSESPAPKNRDGVDEILLEVYSEMLLYQNKPLLANIVSKNCIIISLDDLTRVISAKTGKECHISVKPEEVGCLAKTSPIKAIDTIRLTDENGEYDFKVTANADYIELMTVYHLSLKYVVV